ncbi:phosphatidylglycerophosphatase A [Bacteroidia bacterium]|nr:phosphatidylglycerophosphatase A [Bacteroidia bacterium]GHT04170.1 phosphatidylglycerophosphatase A [Bacteroidia bacterium]GHT50399.1 phosphatidylglycerophosphatase A [Bacteroidia bacterium]
MNQRFTVHKIIATGLGSGYSPVAPGTAGAALATIIWWILSVFLSPCLLLGTTILLIILFTALGVWSSKVVEAVWGEDPSRVVVDEMVGVWIALLAVGNETGYYLYYMLLAFGLFRLFDIFKPLGIRKIENIPGGWGIMLDDVLSGIYSLIILIGVQWLIG